MKNQFSVDLNSIEKAKDFVNIAASVACDVDVRSGRYVVDGKSLLGLFSLNLSDSVEVLVRGSDEEVEKVMRLSKHLWAEAKEKEAEAEEA